MVSNKFQEWKHLVDKKIKIVNKRHPFERGSEIRPKQIINSIVLKIEEDLNAKGYQYIKKENNIWMFNSKISNKKYLLFLSNIGTYSKEYESNKKVGKKVTIPFNKKNFMNIVLSPKKIFVLSIYNFLTPDGNASEKEYVYTIVKPIEVKDRLKNVNPKRLNNSSMPVLLDDILRAYDKNLLFIKKSLIIVPPKKLKNTLDKLWTKSYIKLEGKKIFTTEKITKSDLYKVKKILNSEVEPIIRKVLLRSSVAQKKFRSNLLNKYYRCLFCNIKFPSILDAAHIIDLHKQDSITAKSFSTNNGILACRNHHKLFDNKELIINLDGSIKNNSNDTTIKVNSKIHKEYFQNLDLMLPYLKKKNKTL